MRRLLALILLFSSCFAFGQTAMFSSSVTLGDGEMCVMPSYRNNNPCEEQEKAIADTYYKRLMDNTLLRALGIQKYDEYLERDLYDSIVGKYDGYYIAEHFDIGYYLGDFLRRISKNSKVRAILADTAIDLVCDLCKYYPKDFKANVLIKVTESKNFVDTLSRHKYESRDGNLYIDGVEAPEDAYGLRGFIIRRIINNDIPEDDFARILDKLYSRVSSVDVSANKDILRSVYINNAITYNTTVNGNYFCVNKTGAVIVPYFMKDVWDRRTQKTLIQYFPGEDATYYKIQETYSRWNYDEEKYLYYPDDGTVIIDDSGEIIYEEQVSEDDEYDEEDY